MHSHIGLRACQPAATTAACPPTTRALATMLAAGGRTARAARASSFTRRKQRSNKPVVPAAVSSVSQPSSSSSKYLYAGESSVNLSEYMVVLDKPIGLTLSPDPQTGLIMVHQVMPGSPAADSKLIQVGDILRQCSAVFGEDMWQCRDIRRVKWALLNRSGQVKLILERGRPGAAPAWYSAGRVGQASSARDILQLPLTLGPAGAAGKPAAASVDGEDMAAAEARPSARVLQVAFHRSFTGTQQRNQRGAGAVARAARVRLLRTQLAAVREEPAIELTQPHHSAESTTSSTTTTTTQPPSPPPPPTPPANSPQNGAVPFRRSGTSSTLLASTTRLLAAFPPFTQHFARMATPSPPQPPPTTSTTPPPKTVSAAVGTKRVVAVLPWLLAAMGSLSLPEMTALASQRGLSSVLQMCLQPQGLLFTVQGVPVPTEPPPTPSSTLIQATAMLHRLIKRRNSHVDPAGGGHGDVSVVVQCAEGREGEVVELLAAWLHWYGCLGLQESVRAAEQALGAPLAQPGLLEKATQELTERAVERASRVVLTWPYGGCEAKVAGEVVGGWGVQVPMKKCWHLGGCRGGASRGHFYLEKKGLAAGAYSYKYIIDGTWALDLHAPKALDASGNWNNVLQVVERAPLSGVDERMAAARVEARWCAFEHKCGLPGSPDCC